MVSISVETKGLSKRLQRIVDGMEFSVPMRNIAKYVKWESEENITRQGFFYGAFKPLKESTRRARSRHGYPSARPILIASGKLLRSFEKKSNNNTARVWNTTSYAKYHQTGTANMPKRQIFGLSKNMMKAIRLEFSKFFKKLIGNNY